MGNLSRITGTISGYRDLVVEKLLGSSYVVKVIDAQRNGTILMGNTYIGTAGNLGWLQVKNPNGNKTFGTHTHITFSQSRSNSLRIMNGKEPRRFGH